MQMSPVVGNIFPVPLQYGQMSLNTPCVAAKFVSKDPRVPLDGLVIGLFWHAYLFYDVKIFEVCRSVCSNDFDHIPQCEVIVKISVTIAPQFIASCYECQNKTQNKNIFGIKYTEPIIQIRSPKMDERDKEFVKCYNSFGVNIFKTEDEPTREMSRKEYKNGEWFALVNPEYDSRGRMQPIEYKIQLCNNRGTICDVELEIDGKPAGGVQMPPYSSFMINRPPAVDEKEKERKLTFMSEKSEKARSLGAVPGSYMNGLVSATFKPKKDDEYIALPEPVYNDLAPLEGRRYGTKAKSSVKESRAMGPSRLAEVESAMSYERGVTVLGKHSNQKFIPVPALRYDEIDWKRKQTITLRIVFDSP